MRTVGDIIKHASGQLSDQGYGREFVRWPRATMQEYFNEALKEIATYKPEAFATTETIQLTPGVEQKLANGGKLSSLAKNTDGSPITKSDSKTAGAFNTYANCPPKLRFVNGLPIYVVRSFYIDANNNSIFYVSPPVPPGLIVNVEATYNSPAKEYSLADWNKEPLLDDKYYNNLIDFIMARAYQRDTESQISQQQAQRLFQLFYQTLGAKYKIDAARNSGYWDGALGNGDPRSRM